LLVRHFVDLAFTYYITELSAAVKPSLLLLLLERYREEAIVFLDADILVMRPLEELRTPFAEASIVLAPNLVEPIAQDNRRPSEQDILLAGAYNPGFLGVRRSDQALEFLRWWEIRLQDGGVTDILPQPIITPNKWIDLVPGLFSDTAFLRDETYNVGYWNLHHRQLSRHEEQFLVNSRPLAFFHFSGFDPAYPELLSKYADHSQVVPGTALADLVNQYVGLHRASGFAECSQWHGALPRSGRALFGNAQIRRLYTSLDQETRKQFTGSSQPDAFLDWVTRPRPEDGGLSPFLMFLYRLREDLPTAFPDVGGQDREAFLNWALTTGAREIGYDPEQMRIGQVLAAAHGYQVPEAEAAPDSANKVAPLRQRAKPACSVIVPVFNRASLTGRCLEELLANAPESVGIEIMVVDDGSTDLTGRLLDGYVDRVRVVKQTSNQGFATACNAGAATAAGRFLVFLNNDTIPQTGWLDALVNYAVSHPDAAVVGSKLLYPNDTIQHAGFVFCQKRMPRHIYAGFPADHPAVNKSRRFQAVTGACMLVRREVFEKVGGFDTAFVNGYEDVDLCLRVGEHGHEVHYFHESVLYHLECVSRDVRSKEEKQNAQLYQSRWAQRIQPDEFQYYVDDGLLAVDHGRLYPLTFSIAPVLGIISGQDRDRQADRLLAARTQQVYELMKDNINLNVRVLEAEFGAAAPANGAKASATDHRGAESRGRD
jgi:GT2 family glycosyltransferase